MEVSNDLDNCGSFLFEGRRQGAVCARCKVLDVSKYLSDRKGKLEVMTTDGVDVTLFK
jgi:hypothetical protein